MIYKQDTTSKHSSNTNDNHSRQPPIANLKTLMILDSQALIQSIRIPGNPKFFDNLQTSQINLWSLQRNLLSTGDVVLG